jgi:hypothetical protein
VASTAGEVPTREQARSNMMEGEGFLQCLEMSEAKSSERATRAAEAVMGGAEGGRRQPEGGSRKAGAVSGTAVQLTPDGRRKEASESGE